MNPKRLARIIIATVVAALALSACGGNHPRRFILGAVLLAMALSATQVAAATNPVTRAPGSVHALGASVVPH